MTNSPAPIGPSADALPALTRPEYERYSRQITLPQIGVDGQRRLKASRALVVGAGGLGSPVALYLAGAGVGTIGLVDFDVVDVTNLHRQIMHGTRDVGRNKLDSARDRLLDINPNIEVIAHNERLTSHNALEIMRGYDVVIDGTDNFATRYLVNDACVLLGIPNVYGSIFRFDGQASVFATADGPCYRCLYPEPPPPGSVPSCAEGGVLGVLPGLVGTIQANEAIKLLLGIGETLAGRLLMIDALSMQFHTVRIKRDESCAMCGTRTITELIDYDAFCGVPVNAPVDAVDSEITPTALRERLARGDDFDLIDVREPYEWAQQHIDGARLIPLATLQDAMPTLDASRDIVVMCRSGSRSASAMKQLRDSGFTRVRNLAGGILGWNAETTK
jgi:molybdopterin/thiamine biosynthesis adenylyltransferase/rhodanese-related sulfurtransferase